MLTPQTRNEIKRIIFLFSIVSLILSPAFSYGASSNINATVKITVCGDGVVDTSEQCDGSNLNGASCASRGFAGGTLSCSAACEFEVSACTAGSSGGSSGGSGGGGGIISSSRAPVASATFKGKAYPGSAIVLLKDAQVAATVVADADADFDVSLSNLSSGSYIFSVYGEDTKGNRSALQTFPVSIMPGTTANVSNIFIAPTIAVDKLQVRRGDNLTIFGQAAPSSEVTISINSAQEIFVKRETDNNGAYLLNFNTSVLDMGDHTTKAKATLGEAITAFGKVVGFTVGTENVEAKVPQVAPAKGDANGDSRVNIVDFSIAAYWYKRSSPPASADLNDDGRVDLVDFSIMAFNWTG